MSDYSWKETMAVLFSREIKDNDKVTSGAHTEIFFAATMLAQKTHAPNMKLQLGGSVTLCNVTDVEVSELPKTSTGYELLRYAESVHDHPDTYLFYGAPGGKRYYEQGSDLRDVNHFWFADKFFVGGIQADKWGNANMIGLGKPGKMTFRGPGTIGINDIAIGVRDTYVFLTAHDKRRLVEHVDFISHPGKKVCRENEYYGDGPKWIVTPKCIFDFDLRPTRRHVPNRTSIHGAPTATSVRRRAGRPSPRSIRAMAKSSPISPNPTREDVEAP